MLRANHHDRNFVSNSCVFYFLFQLTIAFFCRNCFYNSLEPAISFLLSSLLSHVSVRLEVPVKSPRLRGRVTFSLWKSGRRIGSAGKDELGWKSNLRRGYG